MTSPAHPADGPTELPTLPAAVEQRVVALAAEALGELASAHVPPTLRRVAGFAPARRARLAGSQLATAVATDADFRGHLAVQVRAAHPTQVAAMEEAARAPAAGVRAAAGLAPVESAALAWILRPDGWARVVTDAAGVLGAQARDRDERAAQVQADRYRERWEAADAEIRELREQVRRQLAELKAENADLRRKLGEERRQRAAAEQSAADARSSAAGAEAASVAARQDGRRLEQRLAEAEAALHAERRRLRGDRADATVRARLLLDTVLEAAQGLRRELALPADATPSPGERAEARWDEQHPAAAGGAGPVGAEEPVVLEGLLGLPRVRLVVDGYNVTKSVWADVPLAAQRDRLLQGLGGLVARWGAEVTVVFDAAAAPVRASVRAPRGVRVVFSPPEVIADDVIRDLVAAEPEGRPVVVVTSDAALARDVARGSARVVAAAALVGLLAAG